MRFPRYLLDLTLIAVIVLTAAWFMRFEFDPSPYYYDEADYLYAVSRGFVANWSDTPAFSTLDLIRTGLGRGRDPSQRSGVSEWIRGSGDMNSYRHWHGPLYYDLLIAANAPAHEEQNVRRLALAILALGIAVAYFGVLWITGLRVPALLAATMLGLDPPLLVTTEIAPHIFFGVISLGAVFYAAKLLATGHRRYWYAALALAGAAFCAMEIAFALIAALLICGWLERSRLQPDWPFTGRSLAALLAPIAVLWPASLYKLTFLKSYLAMAYLAVFRKGAWGDVTFAQTWANRYAFSPIAWLLIAAAILVWFARPRLSARRAALAFLIFGVIMLATVLRVNAPGPRYTVPFLMPLLVFAGCILGTGIAGLRSVARAAGLAAVLVLLLLEANLHTRHSPRAFDQRPTELVAAIRANGLEDKALLAPWIDVPTLHYYFPQARVHGYVDPAVIPAALSGAHFDALIGPGVPVTVRALPATH